MSTNGTYTSSDPPLGKHNPTAPPTVGIRGRLFGVINVDHERLVIVSGHGDLQVLRRHQPGLELQPLAGRCQRLLQPPGGVVVVEEDVAARVAPAAEQLRLRIVLEVVLVAGRGCEVSDQADTRHVVQSADFSLRRGEGRGQRAGGHVRGQRSRQIRQRV